MLFFAINIAFYIVPCIGLSRNKKRKTEPPKNQGVSVIIACHNEEQNLKTNIPLIKQQQYPNFEIIAVDDNSTDGSFEFLSGIEGIKVLKSSGKGKKEALSQAIGKATHEILLFTDADCRPASDKWIAETVGNFDCANPMLLGYGELEGKSFWAKFSAYDSMVIALQYLGFASLGCAYMAVGRNLAYSKEIWRTANGFASHSEIASGDDDLFVQDAVNHTKPRICVNHNAKTISAAKETFRQLIRQKNRHTSTAKKYSLGKKFLAGGEILSRSLFFATEIALAFWNWRLALLLLIFRFAASLVCINLFRSKTKTSINILLTSFFDIFAPVFYMLLLVFKIFNRKAEW
ncbi:MAG: glycosyltransferase [Bacteroidales bacterium]|nr:glycosyltransferase [Bacteroidales bacterium]